uniref:BRISC and BRCA1-A complex member 1 n=1 Tax=Opuntia streptacantha TaxID=393608 RepID=A0A7C9DH49_OPUST
MEGPPGSAAAGPSYTLHPAKYSCEDILFCVDVDNESMVEMKNTGPNGRPITRLDSIKQSILLFINAKLTMNPDHRFAFAALGKTASWILLYCRSSVQPHFQWPANQKLFTFDVIYLHDKPGPDNCPQKVYDALVEALEHVTEYEGYIYESGQGLQRVLFRQMCLLLSHPQQRCMQDDLNLPMALTKKVPTTDSAQGEDNLRVSSQ